MRRGRHLLRHTSASQNVTLLSYAESEWYALSNYGCVGLGLQSLFTNWNLRLYLSLYVDSSSVKASMTRRGVDKRTRHMQTRILMDVRTYSSERLTCKRIKSYRHVDNSSWKSEDWSILRVNWTSRISRGDDGLESQGSQDYSWDDGERVDGFKFAIDAKGISRTKSQLSGCKFEYAIGEDHKWSTISEKYCDEKFVAWCWSTRE